MDARIPRGWTLTLGLSVLAVVAALFVQTTAPMRAAADPGAGAEADGCFRYGRLECCLKGD